jgi:hypothetical protein
MTKHEAYNALLERVQRAGGYIKFGEKERPVVLTNEIRRKHIIVAALFESANESSPLKLINSSFNTWDVDDYFETPDIEYLLHRLS